MNKLQVDQLLDRIQGEFSEKIAYRRNIVMDVFEGLFSHTQHWEMIRKKLLGFFGRGGLEGDLAEIIDTLRTEISGG